MSNHGFTIPHPMVRHHPVRTVAVTTGIPENPAITKRAQALLAGNMRGYALLITDEQLAPALEAFQKHRHLGDATALREALIVLLGEGP